MKRILFIAILLTLVFSKPMPVFAEDKIAVQTAELSSRSNASGSADQRVIKLKQYLKAHNSSMANAAEQFVKEADRLGMDWKLVAAISGNESYFGTYIPYDSYNAWGWAVWTGMSYGATFQNWEEGITTVSEGLKENYIDDGLTTVEAIGKRYAADPFWASKVNHFLADIEAFTPSDPEQFEFVL